MDFCLESRVAIITGASSGIGKATAFKFAHSGCRIVIADLASSGVEEDIKAKYGDSSAIFVQTDVPQETDVHDLIQRAVDFGGRLDILAKYAGTMFEKQPRKKMHEFPVEDFDKTFAVHVRRTWSCCKYAAAQMMKQEPREPNAR